MCVPYGERQVFVEMRKLIVNATEGTIAEYNDQNALVCSHDLKHLVTYIIPDSATIDAIYKCVILLFSEPDHEEETLDAEKQNSEQNSAEEKQEQSDSPK